MFDNLTHKLGEVFSRLRGRGVLSEDDINAAMREIRVALLEADVALSVATDFISKVKAKAMGQEVTRSITPGQQVVKIVHDALVELLGSEQSEINLNAAPPVPILMVGLQGSGKTTTTAKIAVRLQKRGHKKVLMASLDVRRPAAQEQLRTLGEHNGVATLPIVQGQGALEIARRAMQEAKTGGYDVVMLDTAGRLAIDEELMAELAAVRDAVSPHETLLVVDALTGQDAAHTATAFSSKIGLTGLVLTRMDSDARGGAALSLRAITGKPIKFIGIGEKIDALDAFDPQRVAGRILGMGDVVGLVEKAMEHISQEDAMREAEKLQKGQFTLDDLAAQLRRVKKMGGMGAMLGLLPGVGQIKQKIEEAGGLNEKIVAHQEAIIYSMTKKERRNPDIIKASRKQRIATGAGVSVHDVNKLLKSFQQMQTMMKRIGKAGGIGSLLSSVTGRQS